VVIPVLLSALLVMTVCLPTSGIVLAKGPEKRVGFEGATSPSSRVNTMGLEPSTILHIGNLTQCTQHFA